MILLSKQAVEMIADKQVQTVEYIDFGFDQSVQSLNKQQPCSCKHMSRDMCQSCPEIENQQTKISEIHKKNDSEIHSIDNEMQEKFKGIGSTPNQNKRKLSTSCIR